MKKILCVLMAVLLIVPFGTVALAVNAGAADAVKAENFSNTAYADSPADSAEGVTITGKVEVESSFIFKDGIDKAVLYEVGTDVLVKSADIADDGSYTIAEVPEGDYDLVINVSGWTTYTLKDLNVSRTSASEGTIEIYDTQEFMYAGDVNGSGVIDINDVAALLENYGAAPSATTASSDVNIPKWK